MNLLDKLKGVPAPFGMKRDAYGAMTGEQQDYWRRLEAHEAPFLEMKLLMEGDFRDAVQYRANFTEWKKFVGIAKHFREPVGMPSETVDAVWHQYILFTRDYFRFCDEFYGRYFHHNPNLPQMEDRAQDDAGLVNLVKRYDHLWGPLPTVWNLCGHRQADLRKKAT